MYQLWWRRRRRCVCGAIVMAFTLGEFTWTGAVTVIEIKVARSRDQSEPSWPNAVPVWLCQQRGHTMSTEPAGHTSCFSSLQVFNSFWQHLISFLQCFWWFLQRFMVSTVIFIHWRFLYNLTNKIKWRDDSLNLLQVFPRALRLKAFHVVLFLLHGELYSVSTKKQSQLLLAASSNRNYTL